MSADGAQVTAVWLRWNGSNNILQSASSADGGVNWSAPVDVSLVGRSADNPQVVSSTDGGTLTAVWDRFDGSNTIIQSATSTDAGATWSTPVELSAAGRNASVPQLAAAADGATVTAVWSRSDGTNTIIQSATTSDTGASWSTPVDLSAAGRNASVPQLAAAADGATVTAVWSRFNGSNDIIQSATSTDAGANWSTPIDLSATGAGASVPQVAASADGAVVTAVWLRWNGSNDITQSATSTDAGANWGTPVNLSASGAGASDPQVTAAADGTATAVWLRANLAQTATTVDSGVTWSAPVNLTTTSFANKPQVAAAADGNDVTATWSHWNGSNYIVQSAATSDAGENWGTAVSLSAAGGSALGTQVASSSNGSAVTAVWYRSDGSNNIIQASTRTTPGPLTFTSGEFPAATVGVPAGLTVTVTNTGGGEVTPSAITAAGSGVSVTGGTCAVATPIAGWASCTVTLAWIPAATGPLAAGELTINYPEGANSADALALTGTATAAPTPTPSSTSSPPAPTVTPVPTPSSSPTSTPTATPTPMPPPTPTVRTTLTVGAKPASLRLPVGRPTKVVKKIVSNGKSTVSAKCLVNGQKINRACDIRLTPNRLRAYPSAANDVARAAVVVTPKCSLNVRVVVRVVAKKAGAARATWTRSWRVHNQPAIVCSTRGTG